MTQRTPAKKAKEQKQQPDGRGMKPMAEEAVRFHTRPAPKTAVPVPRPFPHTLWYGTVAGIIIGAGLGLLLGRLLFTGALAPTGWEGLFSLGPFTFHFFWTMLGGAAGLLLGGVLTILLLQPQPYQPQKQHKNNHN